MPWDGEKALNNRTNYHAHTARCQHASGTEESYVKLAIDEGFSVMGFSDHTPWPFADGFVSKVRMLPAELAGYVSAVRQLQAQYADRIRIHCALECEYYPSMLSWLKEQREAFSLDYLILGHHCREPESEGHWNGSPQSLNDIKLYVDDAIKGLETGLFTYIAHPELPLQYSVMWTPEIQATLRELCRAAKALQIPLEYNLLGEIYAARPGREGFLGYPYRRFWEMAAEEGCTCIVGVDTHSDEQMRCAEKYDAACAFLDGLGMPRVETLFEEDAV